MALHAAEPENCLPAGNRQLKHEPGAKVITGLSSGKQMAEPKADPL
jgi:hypothetical protein